MRTITPIFAKISQVVLVFLLLCGVVVQQPAQAQAQTRSWIGTSCVGTADLAPGADASDVATIQGLECLVANVLIVILTLIGMGSFLMFIVGAFKLMIAGSNSKAVGDAKSTLTYAIVGIVVSVSAFIILNLIVAFTGADGILEFKIPSSMDGF